MKQLVTDLAQKQIYTVLRQNTEGRLYGITFVDNQNKCVFNGSDFGKGYSAAALQSRVASTMNQHSTKLEERINSNSSSDLQKEISLQKQQEKTLNDPIKNQSLLDILLSTKEQFANIPFQLLKKKKRKRNQDN